jgi:radical SAM enzyme (TIGR01210 family)
MYPAAAGARDRFVLDRRPVRRRPDPWQYHDLVVEDEPTDDGRIVPVAALFLTGRECPWRCVMCDLWQQTVVDGTPDGAIPRQIATARRALAAGETRATGIKLYNAGSFFDPRAVPNADYGAIAAELTGLDRVVVESHPALVGPPTIQLRDALERHPGTGAVPTRLEVAMGLETVHPEALERLNKRMTVEDFARAADRLRGLDVAIRVFLLVSPPFIPPAEQDAWLVRSVDAAFAHGASAVSLIPVRPGNGALEALAQVGEFQAPTVLDIERSLQLARTHARVTGRLFVDLWDLDRFAECRACLEARRGRLLRMNLDQRELPPVPCAHCGGSVAA